MKVYEVEVTREGRQWLADVRGLAGAHTYAGNLTALRENVLEVIALVNDEPDEAPVPELRWVFVDENLSMLARAAEVAAEREAAEQALAEFQASATELARSLAQEGYSVRDIAGALRLTPGRVSQILADSRPTRGDAAVTAADVLGAKQTRTARARRNPATGGTVQAAYRGKASESATRRG